MNQKIITPVQIFINGKFFAIADSVEINHQSNQFRKSLLPNPPVGIQEATGTVVNIIRKTRTTIEKQEANKEKKQNDYDAFFNRMVNAVDDPNSHLPIDLSDT